MLRTVFLHLYVIVMAIFVVVTGNIIATQYGDKLIGHINGWLQTADQEATTIQNTVTDWNKKILE